jgi:GT2 family glycosyltransferase
MIGVVVNYFNPTKNQRLFAQTLFCVSSYLENNNCSVLLSDGSGSIDDKMIVFAEQMGFKYLHSDHKLSFAEGYNQGIDFFSDVEAVSYIILSANDIIATNNTAELLLNAHHKNQNTGCVIPYLSDSDYHLQNAKFAYRDRVVPIMTLNCNLFSKSDLISIGKVPEHLSGYFNDIVMSAKLFEINKKIVLVKDLVITHLARRTTAIATSANYNKDKEIFMRMHGELSIRQAHFIMNASKFSDNKGELFYSWFQKVIPYRFITERFYYYKYGLELKIFKLLARIK